MGNKPSSTSFFTFSKTLYPRFHLSELYTDQVREIRFQTFRRCQQPSGKTRLRQQAESDVSWPTHSHYQSITIMRLPNPPPVPLRHMTIMFPPQNQPWGRIVENCTSTNCPTNAQRANRVYSQSDTLWNFHVAWQGITSNMSIII